MNDRHYLQAQVTYTVAIIIASAIGIFIATKMSNLF
ncbi:MAG: Unknown protein [uncultured Sulfurovum sp.]|uniref:Uncharacterized protein n=1 Tax=uncultured Sulfurovum sp. TaxID=269237 RepID=A0A6S6SHV8_9BACT|nr:MAG: Unknown protein [uncultured Sulfurovum sp.]